MKKNDVGQLIHLRSFNIMSESRSQIRYFYIIVFMYEYMKIFGCFFYISEEFNILEFWDNFKNGCSGEWSGQWVSFLFDCIIFKTKLIAFISFFTLSLKYLMEIDIFSRKNDEGCLFYVFNFNDIYSHCRTVWLSVPRSYKWRYIMFTVVYKKYKH